MAPRAQADPILLAKELPSPSPSLAPTDTLFVQADSEGDRVPLIRAHRQDHRTVDTSIRHVNNIDQDICTFTPIIPLYLDPAIQYSRTFTIRYFGGRERTTIPGARIMFPRLFDGRRKDWHVKTVCFGLVDLKHAMIRIHQGDCGNLMGYEWTIYEAKHRDD